MGACCLDEVSSRFSETLADRICLMKGIDGSGRSKGKTISLDKPCFTQLRLAYSSVSRQQSLKKPLHSPVTNQSAQVGR